MEIQQPDPITHQCTSDRFFTSDRPKDLCNHWPTTWLTKIMTSEQFRTLLMFVGWFSHSRYMVAWCHQIIAPINTYWHLFCRFVVTGGAPVPIICGHNTGQHMYIGEKQMNMHTKYTTFFSQPKLEHCRHWKWLTMPLAHPSVFLPSRRRLWQFSGVPHLHHHRGLRTGFQNEGPMAAINFFKFF